MSSESDQWKQVRSRHDALVGWMVGLGLVAVIFLVCLMVMLNAFKPELFRSRSGMEPTPLAFEDLPEINASFTDVAEQAGVTHVQATGATGERLLPETMGSGIALGDFDGDHDTDLLLLSYGSTPALYRNDSPRGGPIRFTDVTEGSGLEGITHSMTSALGDYDADGRLDVLVGRVGPDILLRNTGDFRFEETGRYGNGWTTAAGFADIDGDSDIDLLVGSYVVWSPEIDREVDFTLDGIGRAYGPPTGFAGTDLALYMNDGAGTLTDEAAERGLHVRRADRDEPVMKTLGLLLQDLDGDGDIDIFVANDTTANRYFINAGTGSFREAAAEQGLAYDLDGNPTGAMGVDTAGAGRSNWMVIGNFANEPDSVYRMDTWNNNGWREESLSSGIGAPTRAPLTFGTLLLDINLDGHLDLVQVNGHIEPDIARVQSGQTYRQSAQLFIGTDGNPSFIEVPSDRLGDLAEPIVGRALAAADLDRDGDPDLLVSRLDQPPMILRNGHKPEGEVAALTVRVRGDSGNIDALGTVVESYVGYNRSRVPLTRTRSYLVQSDLMQSFILTSNSSRDIDLIFDDGTRIEMDVPFMEADMEMSKPEVDRFESETPDG